MNEIKEQYMNKCQEKSTSALADPLPKPEEDSTGFSLTAAAKNSPALSPGLAKSRLSQLRT